jgi:hypothetical protein
MRGEHPAVAGDNAVLFVDQHRVGEAKFADPIRRPPATSAAPPRAKPRNSIMIGWLSVAIIGIIAASGGSGLVIFRVGLSLLGAPASPAAWLRAPVPRIRLSDGRRQTKYRCIDPRGCPTRSPDLRKSRRASQGVASVGLARHGLVISDPPTCRASRGKRLGTLLEPHRSPA